MASTPRYDAAHEWTDEQLEALEKRMAREYSQAAREMRGKQAKALEKFEREREMREKALDDTKEAREAHKRWLQGQAARQDWMQGMVDDLTASATQANQRAVAALNDALPRIYCENVARAAYSIDRAIGMDTMFTLQDESTVRYLMGLGEHDQLIHEVIPVGPTRRRIQSLRKDLDRAKDWNWNRQKFTSAITQGILQGESVPHIVDRVESIYGMNRNAATMAARTACTAAENAGRVASYERAERMGIGIVQVWRATLDNRTRYEHRAADGQRRKVGEPFNVGADELEYPGDPAGHPSNVCNCRCYLRAQVKGFEKEGQRWNRLPEGTTYEEWKSGKTVATRDDSYQHESGRVGPKWYAKERQHG